MDWQRLSDLHYKVIPDAMFRREQVLSSMMNCTANLSGMPSAHSADSKNAEMINKVFDLESEIRFLQFERDRLILEAVPLISGIEYPRVTEAMTRYYLFGQDKSYIISRMHCKIRNLNDLLNRGRILCDF